MVTYRPRSPFHVSCASVISCFDALDLFCYIREVHVARHFVAFTSDVILNKKKLGDRSNWEAHSSFLLGAFRDWTKLPITAVDRRRI
jgi:hypothetical protein